MVQRDSEGRGLVETDPSKQGWVPAGCLLETKVPVSVAIEEAANATRSNVSGPLEQVSRTPILPLSILSTSFPGVALMEYRKKGDEELDLQKDDALRVFKRYNHWSYVSWEPPRSKRDTNRPPAGCQRGYRRSRLGSGASFPLPVRYDLNSPHPQSWFIGKVPTANTPATPNPSVMSSNLSTSVTTDSEAGIGGGNITSVQVSPMSSAFPPMQGRTTAAVG